MWPFKKKEPESYVTFLKIGESLGLTSLMELRQVMSEFGIYVYPVPSTGMVPGTGLLFSKRELKRDEVNIASSKLIETELLAIQPQHKA